MWIIALFAAANIKDLGGYLVDIQAFSSHDISDIITF